MSRAAVLELGNGRKFGGRWRVGGDAIIVGEVVFNTALTGYQEILTDPSYAGQMVVLTYPLIGSYGTAPAWTESSRPAVRALIVRHLEQDSHAGSTRSLLQYCEDCGVPVVTDVDTRALTRWLRDRGTQVGALYAGEPGSRAPEAVTTEMQRFSLAGIVDTVTTPHRYVIAGADAAPTVVVLDYGLKTGIVAALQERNFRVVVLPASATVRDVADCHPDGVVLSNGPGDPADLIDRLDVVRYALDHCPTLGICLGHQLVALAVGGRTFPLKFGHHGSNHPVRDESTGRVQITSHNHGYAVAAESLPPEYRVRFRNLNDGTVEGLQHESRPIVTVQHHPEAGPGPHDASEVFDEFAEQVRKEWTAAHA